MAISSVLDEQALLVKSAVYDEPLAIAADESRAFLFQMKPFARDTATLPPANPPKHAPLELEHFLPYRLSILSNRISQTIADDYQKRYDLSMTEWRVMAVLARFEGLSAREVADRTAMDKVAVSRALARLVEAGRVDRKVHEGDKRRSVLALSEAGWTMHDEIAPLARAHERDVLELLDADETRWLQRILDKLLGGLH